MARRAPLSRLMSADGGDLVGGFFEFESVFEFALEIPVGRKSKAFGGLALGRRASKAGRPCLRLICARAFCGRFQTVAAEAGPEAECVPSSTR